MNGRTAKLINSYAVLSGVPRSRRAMKRAWNQMSSRDRRDLREKLIIANAGYEARAIIKAEVKVNKSIRRYQLAEGTQCLWFLSHADPNEATLYFRNGELVWSHQTSELIPPEGMPTTLEAFDRFWNIACEEPMPVGHRERLAFFAVNRPTDTPAEVTA